MRAFKILVAFVLALSINTVFAADQFNAKQKQEIQSIIKKYLVENPEIMLEVSQALQEKRFELLQKQALSALADHKAIIFNNKFSPVVGNARGDVTLVEFFDYQCKHCRDMSMRLQALMKQDPNIRIIHKAWPIFGEDSDFAARAALASQKQGKFWPFHTALMNAKKRLTHTQVLAIAKQVGLNVNQLKKDMNSEEVKKEIAQNDKLADLMGIRGTPAYLIQGKNSKPVFVPGGMADQQLKEAVARARKG